MRVVTGEEMHQIDRFTIEEIGLAEELLMENAGQAVVRKLLTWIEKTDRIAVVIGVGNNGGDGFVIARALQEKGYVVDTWLVPEEDRVKGAARYHMDVYKRSGFSLYPYSDQKGTFAATFPHYTVIIDTLLGTGGKGPLRHPYNEIVETMNNSQAEVISVDLPSGLAANEGGQSTPCVHATRTITLQCPKLSAYMYPEANDYGELEVVDIGIPNKAIEKVAPNRSIWGETDVRQTLPKRQASSHKGNHGKVSIIAGSQGMTGAAILAGRACHRSGAGLVTLAVPDIIHDIVASQVVEATFKPLASRDGGLDGLETANDLRVDQFDAIAIGPGIGRCTHLETIVSGLLKNYTDPLIIDADGLFHLQQLLPQLKERKAETILTPHAGEMARLLGCSVQEVERNRFSLSEQFAKEYGIYLVLKGPYTIVTTPKGQQFVNTTGNPALAKGGSGDVLTGMILAFIAQHQSIQTAINNAVFLHGKVADVLVEQDSSVLDVLATDVIDTLPRVLRAFLS
ncbi:NAD(P)H-hydrate dehydratase [Desertibacillus haloalkaliphilus]|uniref:NAD(P)H-hydrate dehydratase n=1 Tax=Desertibacillus haloalkaliphilus TaxID=1328930 RepID=UPI001C26CC69|nr:NAD(P)H-hydrate dehydratase [Desertibacillus haloalkaliphilus]MBU8908768.1 NAD(P)H-hydrate dehydratase [Desertibacillus haloalkaliphilus]